VKERCGLGIGTMDFKDRHEASSFAVRQTDTTENLQRKPTDAVRESTKDGFQVA